MINETAFSIAQKNPATEKGSRNCQIEAIRNLEKSFAKIMPRALIQMATGGGKTYTAKKFAIPWNSHSVKHTWQDYLQFFRKRANKADIISIKQPHIACFDGVMVLMNVLSF